MKGILLTSIALVSLIASVGANGLPIYDVSRSIGVASVYGTIQTNGTLGPLSTADFVDWNLSLDDGVDSIILNPVNSMVTVFGSSAVVATPTALWFDFDSQPTTFFRISSAGLSDSIWVWVLANPLISLIVPPDREEIRHTSLPFGLFTHEERAARVGSVQFATVQESRVPEPGTLVLLGLIVVCMGMGQCWVTRKSSSTKVQRGSR